MAGPAVEALLYLLDEASEGRGIEESNESQALMTINHLRSLLGTDDRPALAAVGGVQRRVGFVTRRMAWVFALALVTGCRAGSTDLAVPASGESTPSPQAEASAAPQPEGRLVSIDGWEFSDDRRSLTLHFVGAREHTEEEPECTADYLGWASTVVDTLEVAIVNTVPMRSAGRTDAGVAIECDLIGYGREATVELTAPFAGSMLRDLAGYLYFLERPAGAVALSGLPVGWELRAEDSLPESPSGRWRQVYSPVEDPDLGDSRLEFIQSFDEPVNATGGDEVRAIDVNGASATLYRHPPVGELVLAWRDSDGDGFAIVVNESDITSDELVTLARSIGVED